MQNLTKGCADQYPLHGLYIFENLTSHEAIAVCDHDFDPVVEAIDASENGWQGFLLHYHCSEPWADQPWKIENIDELIGLLKDGVSRANENHFSKKNCSLLISFLYSAREKGEQVAVTKTWGGV